MAASKKHKLKKKERLPHIDGDFLIVGADLSLNSPGFALLEYNEETRSVSIVKMGRVANKTIAKTNAPRGQKLARIIDVFADYIAPRDVKVVVKEASFSRFNAESQALLACVGACEYALWQLHECDFEQLAPTTIKLKMTGSGRAEKEKVAEAIDLYCTHGVFETDDVSDAVAVAIAWLIDNGYIDSIKVDDKDDEGGRETAG